MGAGMMAEPIAATGIDAQQVEAEGDAVSKIQLQQSLKLVLSGKQALDPISEPDSPVMTSEEASAKARSGDMALEEALQEGVFNELMQDQLLNKGQRINIGSPDTYFRPVYATAAGVKSAPEQQMVQGRLQVISTSVLNDPVHMAQMDRQFHNEPRPYDEETAAAAAAVAEMLAASAATGETAERPAFSAERSASSPADAAGAAAVEGSSAQAGNPMIAVPSDLNVKGLNPFQGLADATSARKAATAVEGERPGGMFASAPVGGSGTSLSDAAMAEGEAAWNSQALEMKISCVNVVCVVLFLRSSLGSPIKYPSEHRTGILMVQRMACTARQRRRRARQRWWTWTKR